MSALFERNERSAFFINAPDSPYYHTFLEGQNLRGNHKPIRTRGEQIRKDGESEEYYETSGHIAGMKSVVGLESSSIPDASTKHASIT